MARRRRRRFTDGELRLMQSCGEGPSTVGTVVEELRDATAAYNTVLTMLRISNARDTSPT